MCCGAICRVLVRYACILPGTAVPFPFHATLRTVRAHPSDKKMPRTVRLQPHPSDPTHPNRQSAIHNDESSGPPPPLGPVRAAGGGKPNPSTLKKKGKKKNTKKPPRNQATAEGLRIRSSAPTVTTLRRFQSRRKLHSTATRGLQHHHAATTATPSLPTQCLLRLCCRPTEDALHESFYLSPW